MSERVLVLGSNKIVPRLSRFGDSVVWTDKKLTQEFLSLVRPTFIVSYGYRHILKKDILDQFPDRVVNLHISYLPWNRGADPNFWSWFEKTPKGITIHYMNEGIDTGDIIVQKEVQFDPNTETLATSYQKLQQEIQSLFARNWISIRNGTCPRTPQNPDEGSFHYVKDKEPYLHLLTDGWNTPVSVLKDFKP